MGRGDPEAPIGVLSSGGAGAVLVRELQRALPHEDVLLLIDHAFAPYARRPRRVVADRVRRLTAELVASGAKAVVLASRTATLDAVTSPTPPDLPVRVVGLEGPLARAVGRPGAGGVALVAGDGCLRAPTLLSELRRAGGRRRVTADLWPGLADLVEAGAAGQVELRRLVEQRVEALVRAGTDVVALGCVHAAAVASAVEAAGAGRLEVVDPVILTAGRVRGVLASDGLLVRRRRPGWCRLISSRPTAAPAWPMSDARPPRRPARPSLASHLGDD